MDRAKPFRVGHTEASCPGCGARDFIEAGPPGAVRPDTLLCAGCGAKHARNALMAQVSDAVRLRAEKMRSRSSALLKRLHKGRPVAAKGGLFSKLAAARLHLAFVENPDDLSILVEVGEREDAGAPLSLNELYLLGFASQATVARRVARFKRLGLITQQPSPADARVQLLRLSATARAAFAAFLKALR